MHHQFQQYQSALSEPCCDCCYGFVFLLLTFEKHAPMWTLGVGGSPLDTGFPPEEEDEDEESCGGVGDVEGCLSLPRRGGARGESASARRSRKKLSIK